jgi:hypothetical protein
LRPARNSSASRRIRFPVHPLKAGVAVLVAMVALTYAIASESRAQTRESRPAKSYAQAVGVPLSTIIIFGDQYNGGDELYDVKITVAEIVRGEKALQMVKSAGNSDAAPSARMEYLLARVRFEFSARVRPEHYSYTLEPAQFSAMSAATEPYVTASLAAPLKPELRGTLHSGDSAEGWVAFLVPRGDHTPLMLFHENVGNLSHEGNGSIFKLYYENPPATPKSKPS